MSDADKLPPQISYQEQISPEEEEVLLEGLNQVAAAAKGVSRIEPFAFLIKDSGKRVIAGVKGNSLFGSLYVDLLWVAPELRGKGWGTQLMQKCEELGRKRRCAFVVLTTMDWEALPFYLQLGYEIEYVRKGYEKESKMYFLRKDL